jgi:hypothetical protein
MSRHSRGGRGRPSLLVQPLDDRRCPSSVVAYDSATDTLTITGDATANVVKIVQDDVANQILVQHDGVDEVFASSVVGNIVVDLKEGRDSFTFTFQEGTNFLRARTLDVVTGTGRDTVMFDLAGNSNHWAILKEDLSINLNTGAGADKVQINTPPVEIANKLAFTGHLGAGADRFDAIAFGGVGANGSLVLDVRGEAGADAMTYFGTYNPQQPAAGITVGNQALMSVLYDGGIGKDRLDVNYVGEVDGLCSFYLHGDLTNLGGPERDRVSVHTRTNAGSTGDFYGYALGGDGNDILRLLAEGDVPNGSQLHADGGAGKDECVNTYNVDVQGCES